jgi:hypothetical protein
MDQARKTPNANKRNGDFSPTIRNSTDNQEPTFEVHKMSKDLGQCTTTTSEQRQ